MVYGDLKEDKPHYVERMFSAISRRYDLMNRLMTMGWDESWRKIVAMELDLPPDGIVLDVAAGTGDITRRVALVYPHSRVVALDFCMDMMEAGRYKFEHRNSAGPARTLQDRVGFVCGDAMDLPYASSTFDGVTTGFALRNVADIPHVLREMYRVLKPGGRMVCLEVSRPRQPIVSGIYWWYFFKIVPILGGIFSGQREAYSYLPESAEAFLNPETLAAEMESAGFTSVRFRRLMLGAAAIHVGEK